MRPNFFRHDQTATNNQNITNPAYTYQSVLLLYYTNPVAIQDSSSATKYHLEPPEYNKDQNIPVSFHHKEHLHIFLSNHALYLPETKYNLPQDVLTLQNIIQPFYKPPAMLLQYPDEAPY